MRFVVYGAGGIGGVIGGRLHQSGHEVVLIARGPHLETIRRSGLRLRSAGEDFYLNIEAHDHPSKIAFDDDDLVVLAMKSQDTPPALRALADCATASVGVVCAQNGVANEREALRHFQNVYGMCVMCPTNHLKPGVVEAYSTPTTGILDVGRYPQGVDETAEALASALESSTFVSQARPDIMRWKYGKLLMNLGNGIDALCGPTARGGDIYRTLRREAVEVLSAAAIDFVDREEDRDRRGNIMTLEPIDGELRGGGSTWQSLARGLPSVETDYLNGEIVLLARLHGLEAPANAFMQERMARAVRERTPPASVNVEELGAGMEKRAGRLSGARGR